MALVYPLIAWGDPEDISASPWASTNSPIVTGSVSDPFGGTGAYTIEDDSASLLAGRVLDFVPTQVTPSVMAVFVKEETSAANMFGWWDNTSPAWRHRVNVTWTGGVPSLSTEDGAGTFLSPVSVGSGYYLCVLTANNVVADNTNRFYLYPTDASGSSTGTATFYVRNVVMLPPLDNATAFDDPRDGYEQVQAPSGEEDAWTVATDYQLSADIRHVSKLPVDSPLTYSGWDGLNEASAVNCGIGAMLRAGRDKADLIHVPDRSDCTDNITSKLKDPLQGGVGQEEDGTRRVRITLRNGSQEYAGYV